MCDYLGVGELKEGVMIERVKRFSYSISYFIYVLTNKNKGTFYQKVHQRFVGCLICT